VKAGVFKSMNLDLTVNPDFSQVEVDEQVTNLTRFDIFFPEKRTFFLENATCFAAYGAPPIRPFYSRTIGLDKERESDTDHWWRETQLEIFHQTTDRIDEYANSAKRRFPAQNYRHFHLIKTVLKQSVIKGYFSEQAGISN
jgi:hypothetical protein